MQALGKGAYEKLARAVGNDVWYDAVAAHGGDIDELGGLTLVVAHEEVA